MSSFCGLFDGDRLYYRGAASSFRDSRLELCLKGYIINGAELRQQFSCRPDDDDAALLASVYLAVGPRFPTIVFGEFAAALLDLRDRQLVLASDALGIVPLYYGTLGKTVHFSADPSAIAAALGNDDIDENYVASFLSAQDDFGERSIFKGVNRVAQGHVMTWQAGTLRSSGVLNLRVADYKGIRSGEDSAAELRRLVVASVRGALPRDGKTWCELSGGLDSSTVVSIAAGTCQAPIETVSMIFAKSWRADERKWIDAVLETYPVPNHRLDGDDYPLFSAAPRATGEPSSRSISQAFHNARNALFEAHRVDTVLTGMCGDAVFVGDAPEPFYLADMHHPLRMLAEARRWADASRDRRPLGFWVRRYALGPRIRGLRPSARAAAPDWVDPAIARLWRSQAAFRRRGPAGLDYYWSRVLRAARKLAPAEARLRNPLLYLPLVQFMAAAPWSEKLSPELDRTLQRRALEGILPERIRQRRSKGVPGQALLAGLARSSEWHSLLTERPQLVAQGFVTARGWRETVELARLGHCPAEAPFLRACMLEAWLATRQKNTPIDFRD